MGHMVGKDIYRQLGRKIDGLIMRAPWNDTLHAILTELYTTAEADLVVKMPYGMADFERIVQVTGHEPGELRKLLDGLCAKGLVADMEFGGKLRYAISPMVVGIFEFTMMRTGGELNTKQWAKLFHTYMQDPDGFFKANCGPGQRVSPLRALPHEGTVHAADFVEVLDYEKASALVEQARRFAIGICSCRHEKMHVGEQECDIPLETCSSFDTAADYVIKHGFGREVSKTEMQENLARSCELRLALCADNVQKRTSFICHCCGCCCNILLGVSRFGYPNTIVTSNFVARIDADECNECGTCVDTCPIGVIELSPEGIPQIDQSVCLGCGVCALECTTDSLRLVKRDQRVFHPEDTYERVILQSLEKGTLQNLMFANPQSSTQGFMRSFVGGFLRLSPVKQSLMSDTLRSRFLGFMRQRG